MKSPQQILDFILTNQNFREVCIDELETQLQLARLDALIQNGIRNDNDNFIKRKEEIHKRTNKNDNPRVITIYSEGTNEC